MIKITGGPSAHNLKIIETGTGADLTLLVSDIRLHIEDRQLRATLEFARAEVDVKALATLLMRQAHKAEE